MLYFKIWCDNKEKSFNPFNSVLFWVITVMHQTNSFVVDVIVYTYFYLECVTTVLPDTKS